MGLSAEIEGSAEGPRPSDEGDGATVGETPERLLKRLLVAAGFDRRVDADPTRGPLEFEPNILAQRVEGGVGARLDGGVPALLYGIYDSHVQSTGRFRHLRSDGTDSAEAEHGDAIPEPHVAVADAAEGELRGVQTQRALPRHRFRDLGEEWFVFGVDDVGLPYATVTADAVPGSEPLDALPRLDDDPDPLVAERETVP